MYNWSVDWSSINVYSLHRPAIKGEYLTSALGEIDGINLSS